MDFKSVLKSVAVLTAICLLSAVILAVANVFLVVPRSSEIDDALKEQILSIAQGSTSFGDVDISLEDNEEVINVVKALNGTHKDSYILRTEALGYKDPIQVVTLVDTNKTIQGVRIFSVGSLDDRYESAVKAKRLEIEEWFVGKKQSDLTLGAGAGKTAKTINDAVGVTTAASMTTNGFVTGVYYALDFVTKNSADLASADTVEISFEGIEVVIPVTDAEMLFTAQELTADEKAKMATAGFDLSVTADYTTFEINFGEGLGIDDQAEREAARDEAQALMAKIYGVYHFRTLQRAVIIGISADKTSIVAVAYNTTTDAVDKTIVLLGGDSGAAFDEAKDNADDWYDDNKDEFKTVEWESPAVPSSLTSRLSAVGMTGLTPAKLTFANPSARDAVIGNLQGVYMMGTSYVAISKSVSGSYGNTVMAAIFDENGNCTSIRALLVGFEPGGDHLPDSWNTKALDFEYLTAMTTNGVINATTDKATLTTLIETGATSEETTAKIVDAVAHIKPLGDFLKG